MLRSFPWVAVFVFLAMVAAPFAARADRPAAVDAEIEFLMQKVANSGAKFIRDGKEYPAAEAVAHLRKKLSAAGDRVKTTEDFINGIATKSYLNGKPYFLLQGGKQIPTGEWLTQALAARRAAVP